MTISTRSGRFLPPRTILGRLGGRGAPTAISLDDLLKHAQAGSIQSGAGGGGGGGSGTVTSVAATVPSGFAVSGSPITTSGTLAISENTQSANVVKAGPSSGSAATPGYRALVAADLPSIADGDVLSNNSGSTAAPAGNSIGSTLDHGLSLSTTGFPKRTGSGTYAITSISLTSDITGVLPIANGGTGYSAQNAVGSSFASNPTGTTNTTGVMMGLAGSFTPASTGRVLISFACAANTTGTNAGGTIEVRYGTGTAPSNGAALTGTAPGVFHKYTATSSLTQFPISIIEVATGLTAGTTYWFDVALAAVGTGTAQIFSSPSFNFVEV